MAADECIIAIYGTLRRHPWIVVEDLSEDTWSLFRAYSELLMWSSPSVMDEAGQKSYHATGLWDVSEAGGDWSDRVEQEAGHVLWVQTVLSRSTQQVGLPVAQMVVCAEKVLQRIGQLSLSGVQMIIPAGYAPARQPQAVCILNTVDPTNAANLRVEIDGGSNNACINNAMKIVEEINSRCENDNIKFTPVSVLNDGHRILDEPLEMDRTAWLGPSVGRIETQVLVPEFSLDVSSYLLAHIAQACQLAGVTSPLLVTLRLESFVEAHA
ncbi:hypothetical protein [Rhodococcus ruber]